MIGARPTEPIDQDVQLGTVELRVFALALMKASL